MKKIITIFSSFFICVLFLSCSSFCKKASYYACAEAVFETEKTYILFDFINESEKTVNQIDFALCFSSVQEGEWDENSTFQKIVVPLKVCVLPGEALKDYFEIQDFFEQEEYSSDNFQIEMFYAEKIIYDDSSFFEDSFGRFSR